MDKEDRLYADVDAADEPEALLASMDATATWPAVTALREWSAPHLTACRSLLDVGCGLADVAIPLAADSGMRVAGLDSSREMIAAARKRAAAAGVDVHLEVGDALALPFEDASFDAVRAERLLQWLTEPQRAVAEMVRVTAPGGSVVLLDTDWRTLATTARDQRFERRLAQVWGTPGAGGHLRSYARAAGLIDVESRPVVHETHSIAGDGSDGMFPFDQFLALQTNAGFDAAEVQGWLDDLVAQSAAGNLTVAVTIWGVRAKAPG